MPDFTNKIVLVTGGASGIGRAAALAFAQNGAKVVVSDFVEPGGMETVRMIRDLQGEAMFVRADVSSLTEVANLMKQVMDTYQVLDIAVNNAGYQGVRATTADYPQVEWQRVLDVNVTGVWYCMKYELEMMLQRGAGVIVNLASVAGLVGFPYHSAYAVSKHAVVGLTKTAALEYVRKGIRINAICPGFTDTPMVQRVMEEDPAYGQRLVAHIPARRLGTPEEVAAAILYLCDDQAGFVTGHCLVLDGGATAG